MASQDWFDKDFYKVLGVSKDVTDADLKKTYRKLARKYHPDSNQGDAKAEAKFKEISEAYSVLSDPEQRKEYDQIRAMGSGAALHRGRPGRRRLRGRLRHVRPGPRRRAQQSPQDFDDIFAMFNQQQGGGFGSGRFGQPTGGFRGYGGPQRGADVTARTTIDFITATKGETITLQGEDGKPFKVKIPAGVADGQKIRLRGRGRPSPDGGETGDIVVQVTVRPHPVFKRDGLNLRVTVPVTFTEAALGATIEVPTLGGDPVKLRVAPGTPVGPRAARQGPRRARPRRAPATCSPRCRSRCRRTWTTPRAKRSSGSTSSSPRRTRAPTSCRARGDRGRVMSRNQEMRTRAGRFRADSSYPRAHLLIS